MSSRLTLSVVARKPVTPSASLPWPIVSKDAMSPSEKSAPAAPVAVNVDITGDHRLSIQLNHAVCGGERFSRQDNPVHPALRKQERSARIIKIGRDQTAVFSRVVIGLTSSK